jgi:hypothetical protein
VDYRVILYFFKKKQMFRRYAQSGARQATT